MCLVCLLLFLFWFCCCFVCFVLFYCRVVDGGDGVCMPVRVCVCMWRLCYLMRGFSRVLSCSLSHSYVS